MAFKRRAGEPQPVRLKQRKFKAVPKEQMPAYIEKQRMAGEAIPEGLDELIAEVRSTPTPDNLDSLVEEGRQYLVAQAMRPEVKLDALIDGTSRTAEQQVARGLLFEGKMPSVLPADTYRVEDLRGPVRDELGIAGPYQGDSTIRQSTVGGLNDKGVLKVERQPVRTEYLSSGTEEKLFDAWKQLNGSTSRSTFNAAVGEYYGQQALKAIGNTPVDDLDRSTMVRKGQRNDYSGSRPQYGLRLNPRDSTAGTDRLIENSVGILSPEIDRSGDYRYVSPEGYLTVGDYQMGDKVGTGANKRDTVRPNVLKDLTQEDAGTFKDKFSRGVEILQEKGVNPTPAECCTANGRGRSASST